MKKTALPFSSFLAAVLIILAAPAVNAYEAGDTNLANTAQSPVGGQISVPSQ